MTKKILGLVILVMILVLGMTDVDSKRGIKSNMENSVKSSEGILTVNNCPAEVKASVFVCKNKAPKAMIDLVDLLLENAAVGLGESSPFTLRTKSGEVFTATGKFLVMVMVDSSIFFIKNVSFSKGSATVDFKSMKAQTDLPPM